MKTNEDGAKSSLKVGDVVTLISGGPKMTITDEENGEFWCIWFSETLNRYQGCDLPEAALKKVE